MPEIFSKNCKINLIEYGADTRSDFSWITFRQTLAGYVERLIRH